MKWHLGFMLALGLGLGLVFGSSVSHAAWKMRIHKGATVEVHALADIDSLTFYDEVPPAGMVVVPAGMFVMGSPSSEPGRYTDETQHQVILTKEIWVSTQEVTQSEWQAVMGWNDSTFPGTSRPVEQVTWFDAVSYCNLRSTGQGLTPVYTITGAVLDGHHITSATVTWNQAATGYRLLTETEWEYSCRATSTTAFCNGGLTNLGCSPVDPNLTHVGWYCGNAVNTTHDVGGKTANAWGLHDMHGNVWEWCWDRYGLYPTGSVTDPTGPSTGVARVNRGGNWSDSAQASRSASRIDNLPSYRGSRLGLRVCRTAP